MSTIHQPSDHFRIVMSFLRTDRFHRCAAESQVKKLGIHRSQHMMLMHLAHCTQPPTQAELAKAFEISPAAVTVTLQKLEKAGFVTRTEADGNSRAKYIAITPAGMDIVHRSWELYGCRKISATTARRSQRLSERCAGENGAADSGRLT